MAKPVKQGGFFCGACDSLVGFPSYDGLRHHLDTLHRTTGVCSYCHITGPMKSSGDPGSDVELWCVDEEACEQRLAERATACMAGLVTFTPINEVEVVS